MEKKYTHCPLCGGKDFNINTTMENNNSEWETLRCANCFPPLDKNQFAVHIHESVWYCLDDKYEYNINEINKRYNAIYNYLLSLEKPLFNHSYYFKFFYSTEIERNKAELPRINVFELMKDYPKTNKTVTRRIIENLAKKFPYGTKFGFNELAKGMFYCEAEDFEQEIMSWVTDLDEYIQHPSGLGWGIGKQLSITRKVFDFLEREKVENKDPEPVAIISGNTYNYSYDDHSVNLTAKKTWNWCK